MSPPDCAPGATQTSPLLVAIPFVIIAAYLAVSIRFLPNLLGGDVALRERINAIRSRDPGELLRQSWRGFITFVLGLVAIALGISGYSSYLAYQAAPACGLTPAVECRAAQDLVVSRVESQSSKSGRETTVYFTSGGSATFYSNEVPPESVPAGTGVTAEVWQGQVTALTIGGVKHHSFATRSDAWLLIVGGAGVLLLGITWLIGELALESVEPIEATHNAFVEPTKRRRALNLLLPMFGLSLIVFGFAYVSLVSNALATANALAAIYLTSAVFIVPALVIVFVAWFARAYMNLGALKLGAVHSAWFVGACLLVPPLSLYMPYRLAREAVMKTKADLSSVALRYWWACAVAWLGLTVVGLTIGSPDPTDKSVANQLSNVMLAGSVLAGLIATWLTMRLVNSVDAAESAVAYGRPA